MNADIVSFLMQQLPYRLPALLVYFAGMGLSLSYLQRYPKPAMLVLVASTAMFALSIIVPVLQFFVFEQGGRGNWLMIIGAGSSCGHSLAIGLLIWAAFADRRPSYPPEYFEARERGDLSRQEWE